MAESDDALRDVVSYLWQIALGIEDGDLSAAEKRLRQAQQALKEALERGASDEEIDKLMKELRTGDERVPARIRRARAEEPEPCRPDAAERPGAAPERHRAA